MKKFRNTIIYENLKEIIDPVHSCLVVWDVQNGLVEHIFNKNEFIKNLKTLTNAIRNKMPIIYTRITPPFEEFKSSWYYFSMMRKFSVDDPKYLPSFMAIGTKEREIYKDVKPKENDIILDKPSPSIFIGTNFEYMLRSRNITTIIFTGIATEIGIESSVRDASNRGFYPVLVSDCVSSMNKDAHACSLKNMATMFIIENSQDIVKNIG